MRRAAQECKGNSAAYVKRNAPHSERDLAAQWVGYANLWPVNLLPGGIKKLDNYPMCDTIIFTDCCCQEMTHAETAAR